MSSSAARHPDRTPCLLPLHVPRIQQDSGYHRLIQRDWARMVHFSSVLHPGLSPFFQKSALEFAKHGASGLVLHYFGDAETQQEITSLKAEIENPAIYPQSPKVVVVAGDIADSATSTKVDRILQLGSILILCRSLKLESRHSGVSMSSSPMQGYVRLPSS